MTQINPSAITEDKSIQKVTADITKVDVAGSQVNLAIAELAIFKTIDNKQQCDDAMACLKLCKDIEKAIETKRKELVGPFNDSVKQINTYAKDLTGKLSDSIELVKKSVLKYQDEEEKKALQARTTARQTALLQLGFTYDGSLCLYKRDGVGSMTANELQNYNDASFNTILDGFAQNVNRVNTQQAAQVNEENELTNLFNDDTHAIATADINPVVSIPVNGQKFEQVKGTTQRWVFDVLDPFQIPREYLMVDEKKIRSAITAGVRTIPGVNIYQEKSLSIR